MVARRLVLSMLVASTVLIVASAWAADSIELVYLRSGKAALCPDKATLAQAVGKRLGYQPFFAAAERKLVAEISSKGSVLYARATLVDRNGVVRGDRQLSAPLGECGELIASLALAISITLDPMSTGADVAAPPVENEAVSPSRGTEPAEHRVDPPAGATASREPNGTSGDTPSATIIEHSSQNADTATKPVSPGRGLELNANLGMAAIVGALPDPSPALRVGVEAQRGQGALSIELTGTPAVSQAGPGSAEADMSLLLASAAPCVMFGRLGACAVLSLGRWRGEGSHVAAPHVASHFFASTGLRMMALLPLAGPLRLRLYAGGGATLTRPNFELVGTEIWRPPPLSAEAGAALSLYFL